MVGGEDITDYDAQELTRFRGEQVGFVFQTVNLVPFLTARENLLVVGELSGERAGASRPRRGRTSSSTSSGSRTGTTTCRVSSPAANASASRSGAR